MAAVQEEAELAMEAYIRNQELATQEEEQVFDSYNVTRAELVRGERIHRRNYRRKCHECLQGINSSTAVDYLLESQRSSNPAPVMHKADLTCDYAKFIQYRNARRARFVYYSYLI